MHMEKEKKGMLPKAARYPLFLIGLIILIGGGLGGQMVNFSTTTDFIVGAVGFIFLMLSVLIP